MANLAAYPELSSNLDQNLKILIWHLSARNIASLRH
jgi:hypothetical protein